MAFDQLIKLRPWRAPGDGFGSRLLGEYGAMHLKCSIRLLVIVAVGLAIRLALAPFTGHPYDLAIWMKTGEQVAAGSSPYDLIDHLGYPDLWAFWTAISYLLASALGSNKFIYILLIKLPIIFGDVAVVYILVRLTDRYSRVPSSCRSNRSEHKIVASYLLNPYVITIGAVWGMMDNLAAVLIGLFFLLVNDRKPMLAVFSYCLSFLLKLYPIIFLPLTVLHFRKSYKAGLFLWVKSAGVSLFTVILVAVLPFYVLGWNIWIFLYSTYHQLIREPGGIAPFGILGHIYKLAPNFDVAGFVESWWFALLRLVCPVALGVTVGFLVRKDWKTSPAWVFSSLIVFSLVWCISFVWVSEQNVLPALIFILARASTGGDDRWRDSYLAGSSIALAYVFVNVPIWGFSFPITTFHVESELWSNFLHPVLLTAVSLIFFSYAVWELRRTARLMARQTTPANVE